MGVRHTKQEIFALVGGAEELPAVFAGLLQYRSKDVVNALFAAICRETPRLRWRAISCMGCSVARLADEHLEEARIIMRRFLWSLNDESGGIGWGVPESMAEVMCHQPVLADEYVHMLLSYLHKDGDEPFQDGNFLEHPLLQRGVLWGVVRLCTCRPDLMRSRGVAADIPPYLQAEEAELRGLAALAAGALGLQETTGRLGELITDQGSLTLYQEGRLMSTTVAALAQAALNALEALPQP